MNDRLLMDLKPPKNLRESVPEDFDDMSAFSLIVFVNSIVKDILDDDMGGKLVVEGDNLTREKSLKTVIDVVVHIKFTSLVLKDIVSRRRFEMMQCHRVVHTSVKKISNWPLRPCNANILLVQRMPTRPSLSIISTTKRSPQSQKLQ